MIFNLTILNFFLFILHRSQMSLQVGFLAERHMAMVALVLSYAVVSFLVFLQVAYLAKADIATWVFAPIGLLFCMRSKMGKKLTYTLDHPVALFGRIFAYVTALKQKNLQLEISTFFNKVKLKILTIWQMIFVAKFPCVKIHSVDNSYLKTRFDFVVSDELLT